MQIWAKLIHEHVHSFGKIYPPLPDVRSVAQHNMAWPRCGVEYILLSCGFGFAGIYLWHWHANICSCAQLHYYQSRPAFTYIERRCIVLHCVCFSRRLDRSSTLIHMLIPSVSLSYNFVSSSLAGRQKVWREAHHNVNSIVHMGRQQPVLFLEQYHYSNSVLCFALEHFKVLPYVNVQGRSHSCHFGARHTSSTIHLDLWAQWWRIFDVQMWICQHNRRWRSVHRMGRLSHIVQYKPIQGGGIARRQVHLGATPSILARCTLRRSPFQSISEDLN